MDCDVEQVHNFLIKVQFFVQYEFFVTLEGRERKSVQSVPSTLEKQRICLFDVDNSRRQSEIGDLTLSDQVIGIVDQKHTVA